jgi:hypothetical protein
MASPKASKKDASEAQLELEAHRETRLRAVRAITNDVARENDVEDLRSELG